MIFKRKRPEVDLTNEAYTRWLQACCPQPIAWFLRLTDLEQTALADIGVAHVIDLGTIAAEEAEAQENEADAAASLAQGLAQRMQGGKHEPVTYKPQPVTMGGITGRREEREQSEKNGKDMARRFAGREPDSVEGCTD